MMMKIMSESTKLSTLVFLTLTVVHVVGATKSRRLAGQQMGGWSVSPKAHSDAGAVDAPPKQSGTCSTCKGMINPASVVKCSKKHTLVAFNVRTWEHNVACDMCYAAKQKSTGNAKPEIDYVTEGTLMYSCDCHDYALCSKCYKKKAKAKQLLDRLDTKKSEVEPKPKYKFVFPVVNGSRVLIHTKSSGKFPGTVVRCRSNRRGGKTFDLQFDLYKGSRNFLWRKRPRNDFSLTHYTKLGVSSKASDKEIKRAYKKLALEFHPDRPSAQTILNPEEAFREVQEAYEELRDPDRRTKYDAKVH